jgi:hypothetical protein
MEIIRRETYSRGVVASDPSRTATASNGINPVLVAQSSSMAGVAVWPAVDDLRLATNADRT